MSIGASIVLAAIGAVLYFATDFAVSGVDISMIGIILMIAGAAGLVLSLALASRRTRSSSLTQDSRGETVRTESQTNAPLS